MTFINCKKKNGHQWEEPKTNKKSLKIRQFMTYLGMREKNNNKLHQEHVSYTKISTVNSKENLQIFVFLQTKIL